jgi:hypothetical protein
MDFDYQVQIAFFDVIKKKITEGNKYLINSGLGGI